ncbi:MAG: methylated-DNA--[protein]-cysteine S-methyltransferase [Christensenellales bacterium]|jgi:methylated-DNA-[protein]-cysteine S-methyltransferase
MKYMTRYESPLGIITLAAQGESLAGLWLPGQKYHGAAMAEDILEKDDAPIFTAVKQWLDSYFAGENPDVSALKLGPSGSEFRQEVWKILLEIPYGQVLTYGDIAKKVALKMNRASMSGQAVGGAVGHNPISIIIPCHRVVGSNGSLTGYAGGIDAKIRLLKLEGADMSGLFVPKKGSAL